MAVRLFSRRSSRNPFHRDPPELQTRCKHGDGSFQSRSDPRAAHDRHRPKPFCWQSETAAFENFGYFAGWKEQSGASLWQTPRWFRAASEEHRTTVLRSHRSWFQNPQSVGAAWWNGVWMQKQVRSSWTWCSSCSAPGCQTFGTPHGMAPGHCGAPLPTALWQASEEGARLCAGETPAQYTLLVIEERHCPLGLAYRPDSPSRSSTGFPWESPGSPVKGTLLDSPTPAGSSLHFTLLPAELHLLLSASFATDRLKIWGFFITNPVSKTKSENKSQLSCSTRMETIKSQSRPARF